MKKGLHKFICLLIVFSMLFQSVPVYAFDLGITGFEVNSINDKQLNNTNEEAKQTEKTNREIEYEIISKREANKKFFKMSDGSEMYTVYADQVHYEKEGKLEEINNELELKENKYVNKKASYEVNYEKESKNGKLFEIKKDGYSISMALKNGKNVVGKK